jgi:hypothetical protein
MKSFINKFPPVHPILCAILPVAYLYCRNIQQLPFHIVVVPSLVLILSTLALWFLGKRFFENEDKFAVYISLFWLWLFSYDPVRLAISYDVLGFEFYRHRYFIVIWLVVLLLIFISVGRLKYNFKKIGTFLTIFSSVMLALQVSLAVKMLSYHSLIFSGSKSYLEKIPTVKMTREIRSLPSVFYIILDAYAGDKELTTILGFDNSDFLNYLSSRGFYVAANSHCNFSWTALSMSATLNMQYLPMHQSKNSKDVLELQQGVPYNSLIKDNQLMQFFKSIGYHIIDLSNMDTQGLYYKDSYLNSFNMELLRKTIISRPLVENYIEGMLKRYEVKKQFKDIEDALKIKGPIFVYAHILVPHHPYVFSRDGSQPPFSSMVLQIDSEKKLYLDQVIFANRTITKLIDKIIAASKPAPIIIVQGDHGAPRLVRDDNKNMELRMGILNAYYIPNGGKRFLYESITPINSFRLILNQYFGQHLSLLEDRSYYSFSHNYKEVIRYR